MEIQGIVVEKVLGFRVGSDEDLEAAVKEEAFDDVCSNAAADGVGGFEKEEMSVLRV